MSAEGWALLAQHIARARKLGRFRNRDEFAAWLGVSPRTLDHLEAANRTRYSPGVTAAVEVALGWEAGSVASVVAGGHPTPTRDPDLERLRAAWARLSPDARRMLILLAEQSAEDPKTR